MVFDKFRHFWNWNFSDFMLTAGNSRRYSTRNIWQGFCITSISKTVSKAFEIVLLRKCMIKIYNISCTPSIWIINDHLSLSAAPVEYMLNALMGKVIKHYMNPLHIYCRLRGLGLAKAPAASLCRIYERIIFRHLIVKKIDCI